MRINAGGWFRIECGRGWIRGLPARSHPARGLALRIACGSHGPPNRWTRVAAFVAGFDSLAGAGVLCGDAHFSDPFARFCAGQSRRPWIGAQRRQW